VEKAASIAWQRTCLAGVWKCQSLSRSAADLTGVQPGQKVPKLDLRIGVAVGSGFICFRRYRLAPDPSNYVPVGGYPFALRLAMPGDLNEVRWLVHQAADWLTRSKDTDQWARPWPTQEARDQRLLSGIRHRRTWIVWDEDVPAATVTVGTRPEPRVWSQPGCECHLRDPAVYVHRLIAARNYAGRELGAESLDWAGLRGHRFYGAKWVRIDVWTSNEALHAYYEKRGFKRCGSCADPNYPSGALFQKPVSAIRKPRFPQFTEYSGSLETAASLDQAAC
jgi:RimJ/RimL family protein N-acetyltransferase